MASCFVYGTLQFPEVLQALINRVPRSQPATVSGYRRYALRGQVFPATVPASPDSQVCTQAAGTAHTLRWGRALRSSNKKAPPA